MFGIDPTVVGVRRSRLTYGVGVLHRFQPGKHPPSKKITRDNASWCKDVFDRFVAVDQEVCTTRSVLWSFSLLASALLSINRVTLRRFQTGLLTVRGQVNCFGI